MPPSTVDAAINYIAPPRPGEDWRGHYIPGSAGIHRLNLESHNVKITDLRSLDKPCSLEVEGFQLTKAKPLDRSIFDFDDTAAADVMISEAQELLKQVTGASYVLMFNHVTRFESPDKLKALPKDVGDDELWTYMGPFVSVHVDQSYKGGEYIVRNFEHKPEIASRLSKSGTNCRYAIINVWRPVSPITRHPIAVCDGRYVDDKDLRPWEAHPDPKQWDPTLPPRRSEIWRPMHNPKHQWYYASAMQPDEALFIKCFDTKMDGRARCVPHTAFESPTDSGGVRESVEFRCMVFWDDEPFDDPSAFENPEPGLSRGLIDSYRRN